MEKIWLHTFCDELRVDPGDTLVLLAESPLNPEAKRERTAEMMFEAFNVPAMHLENAAVLALYAHGRSTGVVVDSGYESTRVVPVHCGRAILSCTKCLKLGGRDLGAYMQAMLNERGCRFHSRRDRMIVREIKEKLSYVAIDFDAEMQKIKELNSHWHVENGVIFDDAVESSPLKKTFELPDGNTIAIGNERFRCGELLFNPSLAGGTEGKSASRAGLVTAVQDAISGCDLKIRSELASVVLAGGNASLPRLVERLGRELGSDPFGTLRTHLRGAPWANGQDEIIYDLLLRAAAPDAKQVVSLDSLQSTRYCSWIGGSMMAFMMNTGSSDPLAVPWTTKQEYDESGPSIVHRVSKVRI